MALTHITNLAESFAKQLVGQEKNRLDGVRAAGTANAAVTTSPTEDRFTPSTQINSTLGAAQEVGLFQVSQFSFIAALETTQLQAIQNPAPAQVAPVAEANTGAAQPATPVNLNAFTTAATQAAANTAGQISPVASTQNQIQLFNQALAALGLNNNDILKLDQIATLVNAFSPTAFTDLINQFRALAQQAAQLTAANPHAGTSANFGGYQVEGLSIQFTGVQETLVGGTARTGGQGGGTQLTVASLQIESVQFTLRNGAGQAVNVLAPQLNTSAASTSQKAQGAAA